MSLLLNAYRLSRTEFVRQMPGGWRVRRWCRDLARQRMYEVPLLEGKVWVRPGSPIPDEVILTGQYEPAIAEIIRAFTRGGFDYVDVGANVGLHTVAAAFARKSDSQRIFAFEPEPVTFATLVRNVKANALKTVECVQAAAGQAAGTMTLNVSDGTNEGAHSFVKRDHTAPGPQVPILQLDAYFASPEHRLTDRFLMKIDVEGFEPSVLAGARALLSAASNCAVLIEVFPELLAAGGHTADDVFQVLRASGCSTVYIVRDPDAPQGKALNYYNALFVKGAEANALIGQSSTEVLMPYTGARAPVVG